MRWPYCNARHVLLQSGSRQQVTGRGCLCRAQTGIPPVAESSAGKPSRDEYRRDATAATAHLPFSGLRGNMCLPRQRPPPQRPQALPSGLCKHILNSITDQDASLTMHNCGEKDNYVACKVAAARVWPGQAQPVSRRPLLRDRGTMEAGQAALGLPAVLA